MLDIETKLKTKWTEYLRKSINIWEKTSCKPGYLKKCKISGNWTMIFSSHTTHTFPPEITPQNWGTCITQRSWFSDLERSTLFWFLIHTAVTCITIQAAEGVNWLNGLQYMRQFMKTVSTWLACTGVTFWLPAVLTLRQQNRLLAYFQVYYLTAYLLGVHILGKLFNFTCIWIGSWFSR